MNLVVRKREERGTEAAEMPAATSRGQRESGEEGVEG
jgi:hypothetical protein